MRSILVRRGGALGDFLAVVPLIHLLKMRFPGIRIAVQCPARHMPLIQMIDGVDVIDEDELPMWEWSPDRGVPDRIRDIWNAWERAIVFTAASSDLAEAVRHHFGGRVRVVEPMPGESREWIYRHVAGNLAPPPTKMEWEALKPPLLRVGAGMSRVGSGRIMVHAGAGSAEKRWGAGRMREALKCAGAWPGVDWIVGPADDRAEIVAVMDGDRDRIHEGLPFDRLVPAMSGAAGFLGNDSGPAHLAGLLGLKGVVMFGPSDPRVWRPFGGTLTVMGFDATPGAVGVHLESRVRRFRAEADRS